MVIIKDRFCLKGNVKPSLCTVVLLKKKKKKNGREKKRATEVLLFFESELPRGTHVGSLLIYEKLLM